MTERRERNARKVCVCACMCVSVHAYDSHGVTAINVFVTVVWGKAGLQWMDLEFNVNTSEALEARK